MTHETHNPTNHSSPAMDLIAPWNAKQPARLAGGCERPEDQHSISARGFRTNSYLVHTLSDFNLSDFNLKALE